MLSIFVAYKSTGARVLLLCSGGSIAPRVRAGLGILRGADNSAMLGSPRGAVAQLGERRVRNAKVGSSILLRSTTIQRPTVLGWAFSFVGSPSRAGFRAILQVPAAPPVSGMTGPVRPCFALSSLETCANFFAVAHAGGVFRQWFVRVPVGMVGSRVCCSRLPVQTREASPNISPWAGTDHDRSCCAHGSGRHDLG